MRFVAAGGPKPAIEGLAAALHMAEGKMCAAFVWDIIDAGI